MDDAARIIAAKQSLVDSR